MPANGAESAPGGRPAATVVVPAYRAARTIAACLTALEQQDFTEDFEIVVVASGGDVTSEVVRHSFPNVRLFSCRERAYTGIARNIGVQAARGNIVAFCAADCIPKRDWLKRRVLAHRKGHRLVGGYIVSVTPSTLPGWAQYFAKFWGLLPSARARTVGTGPLFHLSYDRALFDRYGLFPETISGEDTAFNLALVRDGVMVYFDGSIRVEHVNLRSWREVRDSQRLQGASAGALCRDGELVGYFAHWASGGKFAAVANALLIALRALASAIRSRPGYVPRFILAMPFTVMALVVRRRAFRRAYRGVIDAPEVREPSGIPQSVPPVSRARPVVTALVIARNSEETIERCLDSLLEQTYEPLEIVVADAGSKDRTREIANSRGAKVFAIGRKAGSADVRHAVGQIAGGQVVILVEPDGEFDPSFVERLVAPIEHAHGEDPAVVFFEARRAQRASGDEP